MHLFPNAVVKHVQKQASDHCLLLLDNNYRYSNPAKRFLYDKRFLDLPNFESTVDHAWNISQNGTPMVQVCARIKQCRVVLLKLKAAHNLNSKKAIQEKKTKLKQYKRKKGTEIGLYGINCKGNWVKSIEKKKCTGTKSQGFNVSKRGTRTLNFSMPSYAAEEEKLYRKVGNQTRGRMQHKYKNRSINHR